MKQNAKIRIPFHQLIILFILILVNTAIALWDEPLIPYFNALVALFLFIVTVRMVDIRKSLNRRYRWRKASKLPPERYLEVRDKRGKIGLAIPTYYPFKVGKGTGRWGSPVHPVARYWDGGWMIQISLSDNPPLDKITHWRYLPEDNPYSKINVKP